MSATLTNTLALIGDTPLVEVTQFDVGPCRLFLKLENRNPGGSIKDRIALSMIEGAEARGDLKPGGIIVEATAGNTGIGLALAAAGKGYRLTLMIPDKMSQEKIRFLCGMGAECIITPNSAGPGHPDNFQEVARRYARETPGAWYVNQFANPDNPRAHETTTGPELLAAVPGKLDAVVCAVGSGGTITGLGRFFARHSPETRLILADPVGSALAAIVATGRPPEKTGAYLVEGIGSSVVPEICDLSHVARAISVSDAESFGCARELLRRAGVNGGPSSGSLLAAALRYCREQSEPKNVATFVCDSGDKYLSKLYNDEWLAEKGLLAEMQQYES